MRVFFASFLLSAGMLNAQCPTELPHTVTCSSAGGNTILTLSQNSSITWPTFQLNPGQSLQISSAGGESFHSLHTVSSAPANISGTVSADGPLTFISTQGISLNGSISAPDLTLSTLARDLEGNFSPSPQAGQLTIGRNGQATATTGPLTLLGSNINNAGTLSSPSKKITLISSSTGTITPDLTVTADTPPIISRRITNRNQATLESPIIEIYSEGFFSNSGHIEAPQALSITAHSISHDNRPDSIIITSNPDFNPDVILAGKIVNPNDGTNPGGISTTSEFPDLAQNSFSGKRKTQLLPSQFSSSRIASTVLPSAIKKKKTQTRLTTRGAGKQKKKHSSRKRSFFGSIISR